ncbi:hypothetical protein D3C80_1972950 [compost metagenome]
MGRLRQLYNGDASLLLDAYVSERTLVDVRMGDSGDNHHLLLRFLPGGAAEQSGCEVQEAVAEHLHSALGGSSDDFGAGIQIDV